MNILRDKRLTTKILILLELSSNPHHKLKTLAEMFNMTVQAVSDYFKIMKKEGLVRKVRGMHKPTQKGILFLHSNFTSIREFIDGQMHKINIIDLCTAIAGGPLRPGDRVGLFMEEGELRAYKGRSSTSMGMVVTEAAKGEDVGVKELVGIVEMDLGEMFILQVPSVQEGGARAVDLKAMNRAIDRFSPARTATMGSVAKVILGKLRREPDVEFSVVEACVEACQKGLDILVIGEEPDVQRLINKVSEFNLTSEEKIRYNLESTSIRKARRTPKKRR